MVLLTLVTIGECIPGFNTNNMKIKVTDIASPSYLDIQVNHVYEFTYSKGRDVVTESLLVTKIEKNFITAESTQMIHKDNVRNVQSWKIGNTYNFLLNDFSEVRGKVLKLYPHYIRIKPIEE